MLWYVAKRVDTEEELARTNSSKQAAPLARRKAYEHETEVKIEIEEHVEEEDSSS